MGTWRDRVEFLADLGRPWGSSWPRRSRRRSQSERRLRSRPRPGGRCGRGLTFRCGRGRFPRVFAGDRERFGEVGDGDGAGGEVLQYGAAGGVAEGMKYAAGVLRAHYAAKAAASLSSSLLHPAWRSCGPSAPSKNAPWWVQMRSAPWSVGRISKVRSDAEKRLPAKVTMRRPGTMSM